MAALLLGKDVQGLLLGSKGTRKKPSGSFSGLGLSLPVIKGVMRKGYRLPTPIQRKCMPFILGGKDVVAMARTGSGKTAAYLLPMFDRLKTHSAKIGARALILSPTRELATQTIKFTKELGKFTDLRAALVVGGDSMEEQFASLHGNPDIIVATPGRLLHLLVEMELKLASVEYVVFDEADRLFEMGFSEQLREILFKLPESRQTMLFSATLPKQLVEFAKAGLHDPVLVRLDVESQLSQQLKMTFLAVRSEVKSAVLLHLLRSVMSSNEQTVVFAPTKHHVEYLRELISSAGIPVCYVYSSLDQTARKINIAKFHNRTAMVMVVTDVAARGIDIPTLDNVINYNFPDKPKLFVHRVGRVARAGRSGSAYSLVSPDELPSCLDLHLFTSKPLLPAEPDMDSEQLGVYGSVPQTILDEEEEFVRQLHTRNSDLPALLKVADNAQKQYLRSCSQPSPESVSRSKNLPVYLNPHPIFRRSPLCEGEGPTRDEFLKRIHGYRPAATILEVHSTTKTTSKTVMAGKRKMHDVLVAKEKRKKSLEKDDVIKRRGIVVAHGEVATEDDLKQFRRPVADAAGSVGKLKLKLRDDEHYIPHIPSDYHSEKGLSIVGGSFDKEAASLVLDLEGDEGEGAKKTQKEKMKWDRKRKRFVGQTGSEANSKKIKTESGRKISSSYKTHLYQQWRERHKIDSLTTGGEEGEGFQGGSEGGRGGRRGRGKWRGGGKGAGGKGATVGDLKTSEQILRKRKKKTFQASRRSQKQGNTRGRGRGRGKPRD
ncbi:ATP-dependent RNA helicase DDX54 [Geodia barretti]|uniref:RNA helicase n=1 Tax=Geodia barretti TaxID=519541 RepID=A0AA35T968_GEOBA|nr:ATP-dependent RNA helicase DDX54 [Geodia barretti]